MRCQCFTTELECLFDGHEETRYIGHININDFLQQIREQEVDKKYNVGLNVQPQDPFLCFSSQPASHSHAPVKTAFVSNQSEAPSSSCQSFINNGTSPIPTSSSQAQP